MVYTAINHDYHGISHDFLLPILINCIPVCRIQLLWSLRFPTALRRIATLFPWKTVGLPVHSSTSHVFCVQRMGDCRKTEPTKKGLMTLNAPWFSSVHLKSSRCPSRGLWRTLGW